jgi:hypothetical protein
MTQPEPPPPPATIGTNPKSADEVNGLIGIHLRGFAASRITISQDENFFSVTDLKAAPYYFSAAQEATIKSCFTDLNTALQAIDMTFIYQLVGMP